MVTPVSATGDRQEEFQQDFILAPTLQAIAYGYDLKLTPCSDFPSVKWYSSCLTPVLYCVAKLSEEAPPPTDPLLQEFGMIRQRINCKSLQNVRQSVGNDCDAVRIMKQPSVSHDLGLISKKWICWGGPPRSILLHTRVLVLENVNYFNLV